LRQDFIPGKQQQQDFMAAKPGKKYTILVVPDDKARPFSIKVSAAVLKAGIFFIVVFSAGFGVLIYRTGEIAVRLQMVSLLEEENAELRSQNRQLSAVAEKINSMESFSGYLRRIVNSAKDDKANAQVPDQGAASQKNVYSEDSIDNLLDKIRASESGQYGDASGSDVSPEQLLALTPSIYPVEGWTTRKFRADGGATGQRHEGIDIAAATGTLIRATAPGIVAEVFTDAYFGLVVKLRHSYGYETRYCHCHQVTVKKGDAVERGQTIALVGNSGQSSGPHLHYEVIKNGSPVDPLKYILGNP
jgi:murein DD-endopeptidase MepM/ murein hydrolase activator NlpD